MAVSALPTLYEYYTSSGISNGLSTEQPYFTLNSKNITLYSGAMHYFRVPEEYWRDRLRKMRAAGLNTVETYIPWNLHEPQIGKFDFGEYTHFLNIEKFIKTAQEEDLLVIVRPGPFICAEWEFGGLPSWLLREKNIKVRTSDEKFMKHVRRYFARLLPILAALQFINGGPIVGFQIENEYGSTEWKRGNKSFVPDKQYLLQLKDSMIRNGITELLFTSDSPFQHGDVGTLPGLLQTANFAGNPRKEFDKLKTLQKNKPTMAMEYWTGWFDHWSEKHSLRNNLEFRQVLEEILTYPASVNMYMFHGGTNWGFYNGANIPTSGTAKYQPTTTSYDYDAPLSENGDYTEKYYIVEELIQKYNPIKTKLPQKPQITKRFAYPKIIVEKQLQYRDMVKQLPYHFHSDKVIPMEVLPYNENSGQSFGYILYRTNIDIPLESVLKIKGYIHDSALVILNHQLISPLLKTTEDLNNFGYWRLKDGTIDIPATQNATLDIVVENWGRNNFGELEKFKQFKGLTSGVFLNNVEIRNWTISPIDFKTNWTISLDYWNDFIPSNVSLNRASLHVDVPLDTYIDMSNWNTGIVIVNGFVLGRYMHIGPQQTLYLPAPFLKKGLNEIVVFEHFLSFTHIVFTERPIFMTK